MSASTVLTQGFGTFGSVNLLPTLGFGGTPVEELTGRIVRRGRFFLWPEWEEEKKAILEETRITAEMEAARAQRDSLVAELTAVKRVTETLEARDTIARQMLDVRQRAKAELRRMERERNVIRHRRLEITRRLKKIRADQEEADILMIAFIAGELYD